MSTLMSYLASHPLALIFMIAVCATAAWQAVLLARARVAARPSGGGSLGAPTDEGRERATANGTHPSRTTDTGRTAQALNYAGLPLTSTSWTALKGGFALFAVVGSLVANAPIAGAALAVVFLAGSHLWLSMRCRSMETELEKQVLQLEMQMAENSRAGLSVERSLKTCLEHADLPIKGHLERIVNELSYSNRTLTEAFASFAERTESQDVAILASVIAVQQETGANLADTLDFLAQTIEEKQRMRLTLRSRVAEMSLTKAMVALAPLIIIALCCLFIDGVTSFYLENPVGWVLLGVCLGIDVLGVLIINKMSDIPID